MRCMFRQHRQRPGKRGSAENQRRIQSVVNRHRLLKYKQASRLVSTPRGQRGCVVASLGSEAAAPTRRVYGGALLKQNWPRNGPQAKMRVPDHSSTDPDPHVSPQATEAPAAQTPENGRSRRRRVPKTCDCCRPKSGHAPEKTVSHTHSGTKRRGRRKKEESVAKMMTETEMTVDMQEEMRPEGVKGQEQGQAEGQSEAQSPQQDVLAADTSDHQAANQVTALTPVQSHDKSHDPLVSELPPPGLVNGTGEGAPLPSDGEMEVETLLVNHCVPPPGDHHYCKRPLDLHHPPDTHTHTYTHSADGSPEAVVDLIHEYLEDFYVKYGSFIPLCEAELHDYLSRKSNTELSDRKLVHSEVVKYKAGLACVSMQHFKVAHNKHTLTLEDLATLDQHNWLNDQVINMYGELIMEAVSHKVHFFNSFFYRQLVAKGYEGVKRWTKKVDVFSKRLLLVPLHLEVHWSLVAVDVSSKSLHFYDSQGIMFKYAVDNILKYLLAEAKEKKQVGFQKGWKMLINKCIPQQKNDSDCGVFVLEYCKCLALKLPLHFSQEDMPKVRKRIYQELCECKLKD